MADRGRTRARKRKRNKWTAPDMMISTGVSAIPKHIPAGLTMEQLEALAIRVRMDEITKKLNFNEVETDNGPERSPSPEPVYDSQGKRVNTREQRSKDKLNLERQKLVEMSTLMNPMFKPPADYTPFSTKKTRRIYIPQDKFPEYNFIGLIIGPRGNTQKRMEKETGCKIAIRGKGSVKEGKAGKKDGKPQPGEDDELHVLILGDTESQVDKAAKMIQELLVPVEEGKNEWKRQQLRELAEINGTLRDKMWGVPSDTSNFTKREVKCAICGEVSHPSSDCPLRGKGIAPPPGLYGASGSGGESEYDKFLSEIGEAPEKPNTEDAYQEFMEAIGSNSSTSGAAQAPAAQTSPQAWNAMGMPGAVPYGVAPWQQPGAPVDPYAAAYQQNMMGMVPPYGAPWQQQ